MYVPEHGAWVMFVAAGASEGQPAVIRAAQVTRVTGFNARECRCNLVVKLDGPNDVRWPTFSVDRGAHVMGFECFLENVSFGGEETKNAAEGTWYWPESDYHYCSEIEIVYDINHGRETIKAGAIGVVYTGDNTISFKAEDILNLPAGAEPVYPAGEFMNQHAPRLKLAKGEHWDIRNVLANAQEHPAEWAAFMKDLRRQQSDRLYREMRENGMPSQYEAPSLRKAREEQSKLNLDKQQGSRAERSGDRTLRDDSEIGNRQRLTLGESGRASRPRETAAAR